MVVHWRAPSDLAALVAAWPDDPRFELVIVDNGDGPDDPAAGRGGVRLLRPGTNLGFGGGVNAGVRACRAPLVLLLNPDARPELEALDRLLEGFAAHPEAAGLAPRLVDGNGRPQTRWQLRRLPGPWTLLAQSLLLPVTGGARREPPAGAAVEQPAAAALALRKDTLTRLGGFDERFWPAWFEDVDLARRLAEVGLRVLYWPAAVVHHRGGGTVPVLGLGRFLWLYHRHLGRYLAKHHGRGWALLARVALTAAAIARAAMGPLRRPRRAASRRQGIAAYLALAEGAASGWRRPLDWAAAMAAPAPDDPPHADATLVDPRATFESPR